MVGCWSIVKGDYACYAGGICGDQEMKDLERMRVLFQKRHCGLCFPYSLLRRGMFGEYEVNSQFVRGVEDEVNYLPLSLI